ncbi:hypothetical protein ABID25_000294 [Mesorhizobium abyssinicae]
MTLFWRPAIAHATGRPRFARARRGHDPFAMA